MSKLVGNNYHISGILTTIKMEHLALLSYDPYILYLYGRKLSADSYQLIFMRHHPFPDGQTRYLAVWIKSFPYRKASRENVRVV